MRARSRAPDRLDQLARGTALPAKTLASLTAAMGKSDGLKSWAPKLEKAAASAKSPADGDRLKALAAILHKQK